MVMIFLKYGIRAQIYRKDMISDRVQTLIQIAMNNIFLNRQSVQSKSSKIYDTITNAMIELLESLKTNPERSKKAWILSENGSGAHTAI